MDIGHNKPPRDLLVGEPLRERLKEDHAAVTARADELTGAALRVPETINDEDVARRASDFIKQIAACIKAANALRVSEKEPYLAGCRGVDGFFAAISSPLEGIKVKVELRLTKYLRDKEAAERRERMERERLAREEEDRQRAAAAEAAKKIEDEASLQRAIDAEAALKVAAADAEKASKSANAKASVMSQTRGDFGSLASLRTEWTFSDLDRAALDLEALRSHLPHDALEKAVRSFIKAGGRELTGVRIYETTAAVVR